MNVGIIGAGQLCRMLVQAGLNMAPEGISLTVLKQGSDESVRDLGVGTRELSSGSLEKAVKDLDFVTFENEFVDVTEFKPFQSSVKFFPSLNVIELLQNKINQKKLLERLHILTPKWKRVSSVDSNLKNVVLKWARQGYDGKGTLILKNSSEKSRGFLEEASRRNIEVYAEDIVEFQKEVAILAVRNWCGDIVFYPLVETKQIDGICHDVSGGYDFLRTYESKAQEISIKILEELNYVGVLAIEMFVDKNGELLVNELAPRVHNSGHFTQLACTVSQFTSHLRAGLDLSLERPLVKKHFYGMWNLVPSVPVDRTYEEHELPKLENGFHFSWYHKSRLLTGRKMGHINFMADDTNQFQKMQEYLKDWERKWNESLKK